MNQENPLNLKLHSSVTIGSKGQVVISKDVRDRVGVKPWDELMIMTKDDKYIWLVRNDNLRQIVEYLKTELK